MKDIIDYLAMARERGASDVHLCVGAPPAARVNGVLQPLDDYDLGSDDTKDLIFSALSEAQRAKLEEELQLDFALKIENVGRFRGNAHYARGNIELALRYVPSVIPELRELGHGETVEKLCNTRSGLILVTGVTGSGKSTTLASMVKNIATHRSSVIVTIEDPIEFEFEHAYGIIKQRQIGNDAVDFPAALRAAMRQDPDVIVVSEMRDLPTIQTALTAAETGHLVIATLHTIDAPGSIDRMIDAFPANQQPGVASQLANCLTAIVSQRLIRRSDAEGRVMASEILLINHAVRNCIMERKLEQVVGLIQIGAAEGMHTIDDSVSHLFNSGHISYEDAIFNSRDHDQINEQYAIAQRAAAIAEANAKK